VDQAEHWFRRCGTIRYEGQTTINTIRGNNRGLSPGSQVTVAQAKPVSWNTSNLHSSYANFCNANSTREEVVLNFGVNKSWDRSQRGAQGMEIELNHRIVLSPFAAKRSEPGWQRQNKARSNMMQQDKDTAHSHAMVVPRRIHFFVLCVMTIFLGICEDSVAAGEMKLHDLPDVLLAERASKKSGSRNDASVRMLVRSGKIEFDPQVFLPPFVPGSLYCQNGFQFLVEKADFNRGLNEVVYVTKPIGTTANPKIGECDSRFMRSNQSVALKESTLKKGKLSSLPREALSAARVALLAEFDLYEKNLRTEYLERGALDNLSTGLLVAQRQLIANLHLLPVDVLKVEGDGRNPLFLLHSLSAVDANELPAEVVFSVWLASTTNGWLAVGAAVRPGEANEVIFPDEVPDYREVRINGKRVLLAPFSYFEDTAVFSHLNVGGVEILRSPEFRKEKDKEGKWERRKNFGRYYLKNGSSVIELLRN
jgi:hypothetical protein